MRQLLKVHPIETKTLGDEFSMPVLGLGTWQMGGRLTREPGNDDDADIAAIKRGLDHGLFHIDTAEMYAGGHAETLVGRAIQDYPRENLFLATKAVPSHFQRDNLIRAAEASLKRLGTDYLDLYMLHRFNPAVPLDETMAALDRLVAEGLVRYIGVSNFRTKTLQRAQQVCRHKIHVNQVHYNLIYREPEADGLLEYCQKNDIMLVAWRPIQLGFIAGQRIGLMEAMCARYQASPAQVAINWLISQPNVVTLSTMRNPDHLKENLGALTWKMAPEDVELLRRDYPGQKMISDDVPLG